MQLTNKNSTQPDTTLCRLKEFYYCTFVISADAQCNTKTRCSVSQLDVMILSRENFYLIGAGIVMDCSIMSQIGIFVTEKVHLLYKIMTFHGSLVSLSAVLVNVMTLSWLASR